jgi:hypothetical protein
MVYRLNFSRMKNCSKTFVQTILAKRRFIVNLEISTLWKSERSIFIHFLSFYNISVPECVFQLSNLGILCNFLPLFIQNLTNYFLPPKATPSCNLLSRLSGKHHLHLSCIWMHEKRRNRSRSRKTFCAKVRSAVHTYMEQGCQIFLVTTYQNGENVPNCSKIYKISLIAVKYTKCP